MAASAACMSQIQSLFEETGVELCDVKLFGADIGPGSFTGVRVGVTLAKTLAMTQNCQCVGATAFDLIDPKAAAAISAKKGYALVRQPGHSPEIVPVEQAMEILGYFPGKPEIVYPNASKAANILSELVRVSPFDFLPEYVFEPSISQAKNPIIMGGSSA